MTTLWHLNAMPGAVTTKRSSYGDARPATVHPNLSAQEKKKKKQKQSIRDSHER